MADVLERVIGFLVANAPPIIFSPSYWKVLHVTHLCFIVGNPTLRGLAHRSDQSIDITINQSTRWMAGGYSVLNGKEDLTPSGIITHEAGHHFEWAYLDGVGAQADGYLEWLNIDHRGSKLDYGRTSKQEDFAESYRIFITNQSLLKSMDLARFNAMVKMVTEFKAKTGFSHMAASKAAASYPGQKKRAILQRLMEGSNSSQFIHRASSIKGTS